MSNPRTNLPLREFKFAKTRYNILQAFLELVQQKDYEHITIEEICDIAEISRGTFFNYFPSKEHIYTYFGWYFCAELFVQLNSEDMINASCYDKIKFVFDFTVKEDIKYSNQMSQFISHILRRDLDIIREFKYTRTDIIYKYPNIDEYFPDADNIELPTVAECILSLLDEGVKKGEFKKDTNIRKTVLFLLSIYFSPPIICKFMYQKCNLKDVYDTLLDDILNAILT